MYVRIHASVHIMYYVLYVLHVCNIGMCIIVCVCRYVGMCASIRVCLVAGSITSIVDQCSISRAFHSPPPASARGSAETGGCLGALKCMWCSGQRLLPYTFGGQCKYT
jgi:hypothetical protein